MRSSHRIAFCTHQPYGPHISYYDAANGAPKYATKDGPGWRVETVDVGLYPYVPTSIALHGSTPTCRRTRIGGSIQVEPDRKRPFKLGTGPA